MPEKLDLRKNAFYTRRKLDVYVIPSRRLVVTGSFVRRRSRIAVSVESGSDTSRFRASRRQRWREFSFGDSPVAAFVPRYGLGDVG